MVFIFSCTHSHARDTLTFKKNILERKLLNSASKQLCQHQKPEKVFQNLHSKNFSYKANIFIGMLSLIIPFQAREQKRFVLVLS